MFTEGAEIMTGQAAAGALLGTGFIAVAATALGRVIWASLPKLIEFFFEKRKEDRDREHSNLLQARENERLRAENAKLEIARVDSIVQGLAGQVALLSQMASQTAVEMADFKAMLRNTDNQIARLIAHLPVLEKIGLAIDAEPGSHESAQSDPLPSAPKFPREQHQTEKKGNGRRARKAPETQL
jgi:hypothetical protein